MTAVGFVLQDGTRLVYSWPTSDNVPRRGDLVLLPVDNGDGAKVADHPVRTVRWISQFMVDVYVGEAEAMTEDLS